ncbi:RNA 2',3'-cyclic phosphodiesterase [Ornithinibacillus salinisoli]|uniref:RNA 2',3'-cyclic phosphodiesterase n=1 Tax=Ornithinibacillus salinisoli TaxID=1848459 RepID=A0ABW4W6D9_9BACI
MSISHYFIAVPLPNELKEKLAEWQKVLKKHVTYKQWPHVEDLHITLKFLGAVSEEKLKKVTMELKSMETLSPFQLNVHSIGSFGNPQKPRVLWAGVDTTEDIKDLQQKVANCAEKCGFSMENRPYRPHITLAKKWDGTGKFNLDEIRQYFIGEKYIFEVNKIILYQIFPSNTPKYKAMNTFQLVGRE